VQERPQESPPRPPLAVPPNRRNFIRAAAVFYAVLFAAAAAWSLLGGFSLFYASATAELRGVSPARDVAVGLLAGAIVILVSGELTRRTRWGERLGQILGALLGPLSWAQCVFLAAISGIAEEAFFRGALQPRVGLLAASVLFGLAHFAPQRELWPWTVFSVAAGFLLGGLFDATGNLVAPVTTHALINAVNLRLLSVRYGSEEAC
jgi:membrane protease YdiL (CAAX protease family)